MYGFYSSLLKLLTLSILVGALNYTFDSTVCVLQ